MDQHKAMLAGLINTFDGAWRNLEGKHQVDKLGGMQYTRVLRQWLLEGAPHAITEFVLANRQDEAPEVPPPQPHHQARAEQPPMAMPAVQVEQQKRRPKTGPEGGAQ